MYRIMAVLAAMVLASPASAQFVGPSATSAPTTVQQIAEARLGSDVTLVGNIVERQRDEYYTFRDDTGEIRVEIDRRVWLGREVTPDTRVQLIGEVERGVAGRYVDVDSLEILD